MTARKIIDTLNKKLKDKSILQSAPFVYNPYDYAKEAFLDYFDKYATKGAHTVWIGMNPGPWGMAQTGVPFGEVNAVKSWLKINDLVQPPKTQHPKRPILGFACERSEVSGQRLWGWAQENYKNPNAFFKDFFAINYCPLMFLEESGRNITPDKIPLAVRKQIQDHCDQALRDMLDIIKPKNVLGVGVYAEKRCLDALKDRTYKIGRITHPSPASPKANRGWSKIVTKELKDLQLI